MESLFDKFYGATKEALDLLKKPLVKKQMKRRYQSAFDDAETKKIEATTNLEKLRGNVSDVNINSILLQRKYIDECEKLKDMIKDEYRLMFGSEMKIVDED